MSLPNYVSQINLGEQSVLPPGVFTGVRGYTFVLKGDKQTMQATTEQFLQAPTNSHVKVKVLSSLLFLTFTDVEKLSSPAQPVGWTTDRETMISFPVAVTANGWTSLMMWPAYIFIDNSRGMATGRESWGWFKGIGNMDYEEPNHFSLSTMIFKKYSPDTQGTVSPLIQVTKAGYEPLSFVPQGGQSSSSQTQSSHTQSTQAQPAQTHSSQSPKTSPTRIVMPSEWKSGSDFGNWFIDLLKDSVEDLEILISLIKDMATLTIPVINLKQFRDVADGNKACYQALTNSPCKLTGFSGGGPLIGPYTIQFTECDSHPIVKNFGLKGNSVQADLGAYVDFDFEALPGETIWKA